MKRHVLPPFLYLGGGRILQNRFFNDASGTTGISSQNSITVFLIVLSVCDMSVNQSGQVTLYIETIWLRPLAHLSVFLSYAENAKGHNIHIF